MKTKSIPFYIVAFVIAALCSCQEKLPDEVDYEVVKPELSVSPESLYFPGDGGSQKLNITSNTTWMASTDEDWVSVSSSIKEGNYSLTVTVTANRSMLNMRHATLTITDGINTKTVTIEQDPGTEKLNVNVERLDFSYSGGSQYVEVDSDTDWTVTSEDSWCKVSKTSNTRFRVNVEGNNSYSSRQTTINVKGNLMTVKIMVEQAEISEPTISDFAVVTTKTEATCSFSYYSSDISVRRYGICYSPVNPSPTTDYSTISESSYNSSGTASLRLTGLTQNTTYYVRPYVTTAIGTTYGIISELIIKTNTPGEGDNPLPDYKK